MIFSLWFWFGISSSELKEAACLSDCNDLTLSLHFLSLLNAQFRPLGLNRGLKLAVAREDLDPFPFPASFLPILAPSSFVPPLMNPKSLGGFTKPSSSHVWLFAGTSRICPLCSWDATSVSSSAFSRCHLGAASFGKDLF